MNGQALLQCPSCGAVYYLHGDFIESEGGIIRASEVPWQDCEKCTAISKVCGFE